MGVSLQSPAPLTLKTAIGRSLSMLEQLAPPNGKLLQRYRDALRAALGALDLRPYRLEGDTRIPTRRKGRVKVEVVPALGVARMRLHFYCNVIVAHMQPDRDRLEIETELRDVINQACGGAA